MSLIANAKYLSERNLALLGVLLALIFGSFSVYTYIADNPSVTFDIISDSNVLDVHESLTGLNIYYQGEDIQQTNQNLRIITLKVENTGNVDILQNFYDNNVKWGFQIDNGHIIEAKLVGSNSNYLESNLNIKVINNSVEFSKPIFEKNKFFIVTVLILHNKDEGPLLNPTGKIAGIENIGVKTSYIERESFIDEVLSGSLIVHSTRYIVYTLLLIAFVIIAFVIGDKTESITKNRKRRKLGELVSKLDDAEHYFTPDHRKIAKSILSCIPQNLWESTLESLNGYEFDEDSLKNLDSNYFFKYCDTLYEYGSYPNTDLDRRLSPELVKRMRLVSPEKTIIAIGSYLFYNKQLDSKVSEEGNVYFTVNEQLLIDIDASVAYLQSLN